MKFHRIVLATLGSALLLCPALLTGRQEQQESVAEAARRAQAQKKPSGKPATLITNDNLDVIKGTISVIGTEPTPPPSDKSEAADGKAPAPADKAAADKTPPAKDEGYWRKTFADARKKQADDERELDILQREYNLKQQQYYSDPNTAMREQFTRQDLTDTKKNIDDKTAAVAQDKQAISDLEDDLRKAGGEPGWATPPAPPPPPQ